MSTYRDDDFVFVDPDARAVVGIVQWDKNGQPIPLERTGTAEREEGETQAPPGTGRRARRRRRKQYYPWGSYRTMKKIYRLEGKVKESEGQQALAEILPRATEQPYWD